MREGEPLTITEERKSTFKAPLSRKQKRAIERASLKLSGVKPKYQ